jgi:hypothetical protein
MSPLHASLKLAALGVRARIASIASSTTSGYCVSAKHPAMPDRQRFICSIEYGVLGASPALAVNASAETVAVGAVVGPGL